MENNQKTTKTSEDIMVKVVQAAVEYLAKALRTTNTQIKPQSLRLEEIKGSSSSTEWSLTLSYIDASMENPLASLYSGADDSRRIYKVVTVSVEDGECNVVSITERINRQ